MCCIRVLIRLMFCMICVGFLFMHQTGSCICWSQLVSAGVSFSRESYPGRENSILSVAAKFMPYMGKLIFGGQQFPLVWAPIFFSFM